MDGKDYSLLKSKKQEFLKQHQTHLTGLIKAVDSVARKLSSQDAFSGWVGG